MPLRKETVRLASSQSEVRVFKGALRFLAPMRGQRGGGDPLPRTRYMDRWGGIAFSDATSAAGDVIGRDSKVLAESEALRQCARNGARDCKMILKHRNQCAAWVMPSEKRMGAAGGLGTGSSEALAVVAAKRNCADPSQKGCHVVYSACSLPVLVGG